MLTKPPFASSPPQGCFSGGGSYRGSCGTGSTERWLTLPPDSAGYGQLPPEACLLQIVCYTHGNRVDMMDPPFTVPIDDEGVDIWRELYKVTFLQAPAACGDITYGPHGKFYCNMGGGASLLVDARHGCVFAVRPPTISLCRAWFLTDA